MRGQAGFWGIDERYVRLSEAGDPLEKLNTVVPWVVFRKPLSKALKRKPLKTSANRLLSDSIVASD